MDWETIKHNFSEHPFGTIIVFLFGIGMIAVGIISISFGAGFGCLVPFAMSIHLLTLLFLKLTDSDGIIGTIIAYPVCMTMGTIGIGVASESTVFLIIGIVVTFVITVILLRDKLINRKNKFNLTNVENQNMSVSSNSRSVSKNRLYEIKKKAFCSMVIFSVSEIDRIGDYNAYCFCKEDEINNAIERISSAFDTLYYNNPYQRNGNLSVYLNDGETDKEIGEIGKYSSAVRYMLNYDFVMQDLIEILIFGYYDSINRALTWDDATISCFQTWMQEVKRIFNLDYNSDTKKQFDALLEVYDKIKSGSLDIQDDEYFGEE